MLTHSLTILCDLKIDWFPQRKFLAVSEILDIVVNILAQRTPLIETGWSF